MKWLVPLILAQNLNVTPIETRQDGVRVPQRVVQRQWVVDCRSNMTCGVDGGILFLSAASGSGGGGYDGGKVGEAFAADASITAQAFDHDPAACPAGQYASDQSAAGVLTCSTPSGGGKVAEAFMADASVTAQTFDHNPSDCSASQYATAIDSAGNLTCSTPAGGSGGGPIPQFGEF